MGEIKFNEWPQGIVEMLSISLVKEIKMARQKLQAPQISNDGHLTGKRQEQISKFEQTGSEGSNIKAM